MLELFFHRSNLFCCDTLFFSGSTSKPETRTPPDNADDSSRFAAGSYAMSPDPKTIPLPSFLNAYLRPDSVKKS